VNKGVMQVEQDSLVGTRHCEAAYPQRSHASATRSGRVNHRSLRSSDRQEGPQVVDVAFHRKRQSRPASCAFRRKRHPCGLRPPGPRSGRPLRLRSGLWMSLSPSSKRCSPKRPQALSSLAFRLRESGPERMVTSTRPRVRDQALREGVVDRAREAAAAVWIPPAALGPRRWRPAFHTSIGPRSSSSPSCTGTAASSVHGGGQSRAGLRSTGRPRSRQRPARATVPRHLASKPGTQRDRRWVSR
jgi:hypothetical protein